MRPSGTVQHSSAVDDAYVAGFRGSGDAGFLDLGIERIEKISIGLGGLLELIVLSHFVELPGRALDLRFHNLLTSSGRRVRGSQLAHNRRALAGDLSLKFLGLVLKFLNIGMILAINSLRLREIRSHLSKLLG